MPQDIPAVASSVDVAVRNVLTRAREELQILLGFRGDRLDKALTLRDFGYTDISTLKDGFGGVGPAGPTGPTGPPGPAGSETPDLTPPPTVTGLTITAGLANVFIEWDAAVYTQGHGHGQTNLYAAKKAAADPTLPTFGDAVRVYAATGALTLAALPSDLSIRWHVWAKWQTADGVESSSPAGGTNGVVAQTGKIGNADLGPLIVEAGNLADGSITATKVAANAIELTKFASGIEPVTIVSAVPGALVTKTVFNTTDGKLYRWDGAAYIATIPAADLSTQIVAGQIAVNAVTAGTVAAGAINTAQLAAGAVRAQHLLVAPKSLNPDPSFEQGAVGWLNFVQRLASSNVAVPAGCPRQYAAQFSGRDNNWLGPPLAVSPGEQYKLSVYVNLAGGSGGAGAGIVIFGFDAAGTITFASGFAGITTAGWQLSSGVWAVPAGVVGMLVGPWVDKPTFTGSNPWFTDFNIEKVNDASLIVDGAITANKIAANAIAVGSAAIQNGAIVNAMIGAAAIDDAKIASLSAAKVTFGVMHGDRIDVNTLNGNRILANTVTATQIDSRGLSIKDAGGAVILSSGTNLDWSRLGGNGKPATFRVNSQGVGTTTSPISMGLYDAATGTQLQGPSLGYNIVKINRATGAVTLVIHEQPLNSGTGANVAAALNAIGNDHIVVIFTYDEPSTNRLVGTPSLANAIYRCGGSRGVFESSRFNFRCAYILIGVPGSMEGNGFELLQPYDGSNSWVDTTFSVVNGNPVFSSGASLFEITSSNASTYIANAAIGTAQIANAAIGTAQINTLDASVITAGTITTDKLSVTTLSATLIQSFSSQNYTASNNAIGSTNVPGPANFTSRGGIWDVNINGNAYGFVSGSPAFPILMESTLELWNSAGFVASLGSFKAVTQASPTILRGPINVSVLVNPSYMTAGTHSFFLRVALGAYRVDGVTMADGTVTSFTVNVEWSMSEGMV